MALLSGCKRHDLRELYRFWSGAGGRNLPTSEDELRDRVFEWMTDPALVEERLAALGRKLGDVMRALMRAPRYRKSWVELTNARRLAYMSAYDLEACLTALAHHGLVIEGEDQRFERHGERVIAIPVEVGDGILRRRQARARGIFQVFTLRGHLDQMYAAGSTGSKMSPQRVREIYKMYSQETACAARVERLPGGVRGLVEKAILQFGGVLPKQLFERMETDLPHWNGRRWRMILEQSLVGTVQDVDLSKYGIQHDDETLVVFNEVALAWLRRVAVPGDPDRPHEELSLGIDLTSNISRFLAYLQENDVRFTMRGQIFKTTEKKIIQHLIPNPGRELSREEVLSFVFAFCKHEELIDKTGERTFAVTSSGREWGQLKLLDKQKALLDFALEDRRLGGEPFHQQRMRQILLRLVKRVEPGVWYDLMYLPFLARNAYLSKLDDLGVEEHFVERTSSSSCGLEDPQRLAWNLVRWVRQRLFLLGLVDLGYDKQKRPVAVRLTKAGGRLLGVDGDEVEIPESAVGTLVVTPDFEVVLFPTGDDAELIHDLDRFCLREKLGSLMHFRISEEALQRALKDGMSLEHILRTLELHSRTPVPQNVHFSIRDWALRAGLMTLDDELTVRCADPEAMRRFKQDPGARAHIDVVVDDTTVRLKGRITPRRMRSLLRDLGFLVELDGRA
ncbi:MAG: helicase-associated domain-containing protein [Planctomycetota bacterium]|nr:helicase-associated domain-containing protein [Planctomycetota bacterium]